jgi:hypothetical protein
VGPPRLELGTNTATFLMVVLDDFMKVSPLNWKWIYQFLLFPRLTMLMALPIWLFDAETIINSCIKGKGSHTKTLDQRYAQILWITTLTVFIVFLYNCQLAIQLPLDRVRCVAWVIFNT